MYLVLTGNEYGIEIEMNTATKLFSNITEAEHEYDKMLEEHSCAALFAITEFEIIPIKNECNF